MRALPDNPVLRGMLERAASGLEDEQTAGQLSEALRGARLLVAAEEAEPLRYAAARSPQGRTVLLVFSGPAPARSYGDLDRVVVAGLGELTDIAAEVGAEGIVLDLGSPGGLELPLDTLRVIADGGVPLEPGRYREPGGTEVHVRPPAGRFTDLLEEAGDALRRAAPGVALLAYEQRASTGVWNPTLAVAADHDAIADADRAAHALVEALPSLLAHDDVVDVRVLPASFAAELAGVATRVDRGQDGQRPSE